MKELALKTAGGYEINPPPGLSSAFSPNKHLGDIISTLISFAFEVAIVVAFIWAMVGVLQYILAGGNKENLAKARGRIQWALIGLLFLIISFGLSEFIRNYLITKGMLRP